MSRYTAGSVHLIKITFEYFHNALLKIVLKVTLVLVIINKKFAKPPN